MIRVRGQGHHGADASLVEERFPVGLHWLAAAAVVVAAVVVAAVVVVVDVVVVVAAAAAAAAAAAGCKLVVGFDSCVR